MLAVSDLNKLRWCFGPCLCAGLVSHRTYTDPVANCSQEQWPSFPSPAHHHPFLTLSLCWDHTACRHISLLSTRSGASPGDTRMVGVMRDMGWEHIAGGLAAACKQKQQRLMSAHASPNSAALASRSCWCQCSWSYAIGQIQNLIQLKPNMTVKQKNTQRSSAMGIVALLRSAHGLQTVLLLLGERQEHSAGRAVESRKARLDMSIYAKVSLQGLKIFFFTF